MSSPLPWANKALGQHFLRDKKIIAKIVEAFANEAQSIVEVGPGPGILTEHLAKIDKPFFAIEKDKRFEENLKPYLKEGHLFFADALEYDLPSLLEGKNDVWLVSNLPYNLSVPLLIKFIKTPPIQFMTLMFQKEVGDRIHHDMGPLMVLAHTYFELDLAIKVPPGAFVPPPQVDSVVINFSRRKDPLIPLAEFSSLETFLRQLFQMRRKQIHKVLKQSFDPEKITNALENVEINKTERAHSLELSKVQKLFRQFYP